MQMKHLKREKRKKLPLLATLGILTALALLLSGGVITLAKYLWQSQSGGTAVAKPFYFSSDKLNEDGPYYQLDAVGGSTVTVGFQLWNHMDEYRITSEAFSCKWKATAQDGTVLHEEETVNFTGSGAVQSQDISCSIDVSWFENNEAVTLTAYTEHPYAKTISARFGFARNEEQLHYRVTQKGNAVVLEIGGGAGSVTVVWPETLVPDKTDPLFAGAETGRLTFQASGSTRYALTFFRTDPTGVYSENSFTVTRN